MRVTVLDTEQFIIMFGLKMSDDSNWCHMITSHSEGLDF